MEIPSGERPKGNCASDANNCSTSVSKLFYICLKARTWKKHMTKTSGAEEKVASSFCTGDVGEAELPLALPPDPGTYMYM